MKKKLLMVLSTLLIIGGLNITSIQAEDKVESFVTRLYSLCLNRQPDAKGKADWVDQLAKLDLASFNTQNVDDMADIFNGCDCLIKRNVITKDIGIEKEFE